MPTKAQQEIPVPNYEYNTSLQVGWFGNILQILPVSIEDLKRYLLNPQVENRGLRDIANFVYTANGVVRNVIDNMVALPTLDRIVYSKSRRRDGSKPIRYARNKTMFSHVLDIIKDKELARDCLLRNCNDGISFYYFAANQKPYEEKFIDPMVVETLISLNDSTGEKKFEQLSRGSKVKFIKELNALEEQLPENIEVEINARTGDINCSLLPLPTDWCKIVGIKNNSYVVAFDLGYFNMMVTSGLKRKLMQFPKEIRDAWKRYTVSRKAKQWFVLDNTKTVVTKIGSKRSDPWGLPIATAGLVDVLYYMYFLDTKRNALDTLNNKVIYQTFPAADKGNVSTLTQPQQQRQHDVIKNALHNQKQGQLGLSFFSLAPGTKIDILNTDTGILTSGQEDKMLENLAGDMGFAAALLNGVSKGNYASLKLNIELVSARIMTMLQQFQEELIKVINYNVIKDRSCWMEFAYLSTTRVNRQDTVKDAKDLYLQGKGSLSVWLSATGFNPESYIAILEEELEQDWEGRFPVHGTSYTQSGGNEGGRPETPNTDNENTIKSAGANEQGRPGV